MHDFMKTIISSLQTWTNKRIKNSTPNWNQNDSEADGYIKNRPFYTDGENIVQIDKRYLPDATTYLDENVFRPDYEIYDETQVGYIKNRPCYYQKQEWVNTEVITTNSTEWNYIAHNCFDFASGITYLVECTLRYTSNNGEIKEYSVAQECVSSENELHGIYLDNPTQSIMIESIYGNNNSSEYAGMITIANWTHDMQIAANDFQITITALKQLDEVMIPDTIARVEAVNSVVNEEVYKAKDYIAFIDQVNGYTYIACMRDGNFVTYCAVKSIEVTTMPAKTEYMAGEYFDPNGMIVTAVNYDGSTREITDFAYPSTYIAEGTTSIEITYVEYGITYVAFIPVTVSAFDAATALVDFTYTDNGNGTYTITGWNGTLNGNASTEMIIPNYGCIIV